MYVGNNGKELEENQFAGKELGEELINRKESIKIEKNLGDD